MKQYLQFGQKVTFVTGDGKSHQGTITHIYSEDTANVEWDKGSGIGSYSEKDEPNTFHFEQASPKAEHKK